MIAPRARHRALPRVLLATLGCLLALVPAVAANAADSSLGGTLLVADERLAGTPFARAVILVLDHGPDGARGLVLNRPAETPLADALPEGADEPAHDYPLHLGGPVRMQRLALLVRTDDNERGLRPILPGVAYTHAESAFEAILASDPGPGTIRVFAGYAGWAPGQLEHEIQRGDWHIVPAGASHIFEDAGDGLWRRLHEQATGSAKGGPLHSI